MAVLAPIPGASAATATAVNAGFAASRRRPWRRSLASVFILTLLFDANAARAGAHVNQRAAAAANLGLQIVMANGAAHRHRMVDGDAAGTGMRAQIKCCLRRHP